MHPVLRANLEQLAALTATVLAAENHAFSAALNLVTRAVDRRGTLFFCGNGGSAADAQHLAAEYVVRLMRNRRAYPAVALTTDSSVLTAIGNDFGYEQVFARQIEALATPGDLLIIHSTSGNSPNVLAAARTARGLGVEVIAFTAEGGGRVRDIATVTVCVPTGRTDRAQEMHLLLEHTICEIIEASL